jgi:hypothetical protein
MPSVFTLDGPRSSSVAIPTHRFQLSGLGRILPSLGSFELPALRGGKTLMVLGGLLTSAALLYYLTHRRSGLSGVEVYGDEDLGAKLHEYHGGQGDPVYAVGSMFYAGEPADSDAVHDAADNLETMRARGAPTLARTLRRMANAAERRAGYGRRSRI